MKLEKVFKIKVQLLDALTILHTFTEEDEMKLKKVREIKAQLLEALALTGGVEKSIVEAEFDKYADRLVALINDIENGSDFRITFKRAGEDTFTNVLPPHGQLSEDCLRDLALTGIIHRLEDRAERDGLIVVVEPVDVLRKE